MSEATNRIRPKSHSAAKLEPIWLITRARLSDTASSGAKRRTKTSIPGSVRGTGEGGNESADNDGQLVGLERDLQAALRRAIEQLEPGLEIIDDGAERSVASGFIDITAWDARGAIVVVELKTGIARQGAVAQVLSYMGDIAEEEPDQAVRGLLVAGDFDKKARSAARVLPSHVLSLRSYRVRFEFKDVDEVDETG